MRKKATAIPRAFRLSDWSMAALDRVQDWLGLSSRTETLRYLIARADAGITSGEPGKKRKKPRRRIDN